VLGGTRFVGRAVVADALARGWDVTAVHRGVTDALPSEVATLEVDRSDPAALEAALGDGRWDGVVDTWSGAPAVATAGAALLAGRAERYAFVSSISVYRWGQHRDERSPLVDGDPATGDDVDHPALERGAEDGITASFPDALLARAGLVLGPHEDIGRLPWWLPSTACPRRSSGGCSTGEGDGRDPCRSPRHPVVEASLRVVRRLEEQRPAVQVGPRHGRVLRAPDPDTPPEHLDVDVEVHELRRGPELTGPLAERVALRARPGAPLDDDRHAEAQEVLPHRPLEGLDPLAQPLVPQVPAQRGHPRVGVEPDAAPLGDEPSGGRRLPAPGEPADDDERAAGRPTGHRQVSVGIPGVPRGASRTSDDVEVVMGAHLLTVTPSRRGRADLAVPTSASRSRKVPSGSPSPSREPGDVGTTRRQLERGLP